MSLYQSIISPANYLAGHFHQSGAGTLPILHKYDRSVLAEVPLARASDMEKALDGAQRAAPAFRKWSAAQRSQALSHLHDRLGEEAEAFAQLIVAEAGKPLSYARGEVSRCQITLATAAAEVLRFGGEYVPLDFAAGEGRTALSKRFPAGPISAISPFNFPLNLALHKLAPALAVGAPIVLKPSPFAPLTALAFARLIDELELPEGTVSILICENEVAEALVRDPRMAMFSFTGSPKVGWQLKSLAGKKKVTLELGGNAAVIIDEGTDLQAAATRLATGAFLYAGQICISTQRIYVIDALYEAFMNEFVPAVEALQTGDPANEGTSVGPIISPEHLHRIATWVGEAIGKGAQAQTGGHILDKDRNLYAPTILTHTRRDMKVVQEEVFGPVAVVERVADFQAAMDAVNDSRYGLQAGLYTNRFDHVRRAHDELVVGGLMINEIPGFRVDSMPYGGVKESGFGREGIRYAMEEMTEPRLLVY